MIRAATSADAAAIARVHQESWQEAYRGIVPHQYLAGRSYEQRKSAWDGALSKRDSVKFVGVAEDQSKGIVGFAVGGPERSGDPVYRGELEAIYILGAYQRQGIGRLLFG